MKHKINAFILDDEIAAAENISILLNNYCPEVNVIGMAHSISEGIKMVKQLKPELLFLDISMPPEGTGFDFLELFPYRDFHVIFVTAHEQYSLKAIKEHAFDYLLKPIDYRELITTMSDFEQIRTTQNPNIITLSTDTGIHVVKPENILYCKAAGSYTEFHLKDASPILISKPLKFALSLLTQPQFKRVHRSFLVNTLAITKITKEDGGTLYIDNTGIPVSKTYFENIYDLVN